MKVRRALASLAGALMAIANGDAHADATTASCYDAHEEGQLLEKRGEWKRARERFAACASVTCPSIVARDCVTFAAELEKKQPALLVSIVDGQGRDIGDARVLVDGAAIKNEGRAIELDPGPHTVRAELPDGLVLEEKLVLREGDRSRVVRLTRPAPRATTTGAKSTTPTPATADRVPTASIGLGALAVAGLTTFGVFAALGVSRANDLESSCGTRCSDDEVDSVRRRFLVADIALGAAVIAGGAALVLWLTRPSAKATAQRSLPLTFE